LLRRVIGSNLDADLVQLGGELPRSMPAREHLRRGTVRLLQHRFQDVVAADRSPPASSASANTRRWRTAWVPWSCGAGD
jgi:hypothetical protein